MSAKTKAKPAPAPVPTPSNASMNAPTLFDFSKLSTDGFDTETYVRTLLQKLPHEGAVQQLHASLSTTREQTSLELQRNVYKNYNEFVIISKEITKLEKDMLACKKVLQDLRVVKGMFEESLPQEQQSQEFLYAQKQEVEVVDRETEVGREALKQLYKEVDGLQKVLPDVASRVLLHDGSLLRIWEVHPDTLKQKDQLIIHVLSDYLVIAASKKNLMTGKYKTVVDKVCPLTDIGCIDMKDSNEIQFAFKIISGVDTLMFKAGSLQEKRALLSVIMRVTGEILAAKKQQLEKQKSVVQSATIQAPSKAKFKYGKTEITDNLSNTDLGWLTELPDELDVLIAHRDFGPAITMIERARSIIAECPGETPRLHLIRANVNERIISIAKLVSMDLTSPATTKTQIQEDIQRLQRLGLGDQARDLYLNTRASLIRHRLRQLQFNGDLLMYIMDYSEIFFRLIKNTCEWFSVSFHDASMASGFMKWIQNQVFGFSKTFKKQIFGMKNAFSVIVDCVLTTLDKCRLLNEVGIDVSYTFEKFIILELVEAIQIHSNKVVQEIEEFTYRDPLAVHQINMQLFEDNQLPIELPLPALSKSVEDFYVALTTFGAQIGALLGISLYNTVVNGLGNFFKTYVSALKKLSESDHSVVQYALLLSNAKFIVSVVFPHTIDQLTDRFDRKIPELLKVMKGLKLTFKNMRQQTLEKVEVRVKETAKVLETILPSKEVFTLCKGLEAIKALNNNDIDGPKISQDLLQKLFVSIDTNNAAWQSSTRKFGFGGVQQFALDMHFILILFKDVISQESNDLANSLCEKAIKAYMVANKDMSTPLKTMEFYNERVEAAIKHYRELK